MMQIGLIDENDQLAEATLDDRVFNIGMSWNEEAQFWTMSIRDINLELLASGIAVVGNYPLLSQIRRIEFPEGELVVDVDPTKPITRTSFTDGTARLYYFTQFDLDNLPEPVIEEDNLDSIYNRLTPGIPIIDTGVGTGPIIDPPPDTTPIADYLFLEDGSRLTDDNGIAIEI